MESNTLQPSINPNFTPETLDFWQNNQEKAKQNFKLANPEYVEILKTLYVKAKSLMALSLSMTTNKRHDLLAYQVSVPLTNHEYNLLSYTSPMSSAYIMYTYLCTDDVLELSKITAYDDGKFHSAVFKFNESFIRKYVQFKQSKNSN